MRRLCSLFLFFVAAGWTITSANAGMICNLTQVNSSFLVLEYSGSVDTSKLASFIASNYDQGAPVFSSQQGYFRVGQFVDFYSTGSLPNPGTPFGNGGQVPVVSVAPGSSAFQFDFVGKTLSLPVGYISNSLIEGSAVINGSLSYHGISPGTYVYSWAGGSESVVLNVIVPEPASMSLFAIGSVLVGVRLYRRKRMTVA